jgi:NAD(P)-dependent dehydrogenase (short-subunit alcohol dehydrogenase family)
VTSTAPETNPDTAPQAASAGRPLLGRRALVTGATAGIGAAIATALGRDGAEVLVLGRDAERGAGIVATPEVGVDDFDAMFAANVRAPYYLVAAFAPGMAARGWGSIINIGSMAGTVGLAGGAAYGATKAAVAALTRSWAAEYSASGVRVNTVAPGPVYTRPEARDLFDTIGATTALGRAAEPDEIAGFVAFLASDNASYITGATLAVDGGRTAI